MPSFNTFGQKTKIFWPKFIFGCMGGGRWAWPIFIKIQIFLNFHKRNITAKFQDPTMTPSIFVRKMYGLETLCVVRWTVVSI